jgi:ribosomal protein S18 acetylase RimI-like enzyme
VTQAPRPPGGGRCRVEPIDHRDPAMAGRIHAVWAQAAAQEAALLKATLPPSGAASVAARAAFFLGAWDSDDLLGALALGPGDEAGQLAITTLVVAPAWQRQGIARTLLAEALRRADARAGTVVTVVTAVANAPALALYRGCGFVEQRRGVIESVVGNGGGGESLLMVQLRRSPTA